MGLLFIALSINRDHIARHPGYRSVARQTGLAFISILVVTALVLIPTQSPRWLGGELVAGDGIGLVWEIAVQRRVARALDEYVTRYLQVSLLCDIGMLGVLAGAIVLIVGSTVVGLDVIAAATILLGLTAIRNSWALVMNVNPPDADE
ncbi:MAG TPA: hypothetical protein VHT75_17960 [Acidimicrobiales bacterium]|jgi:hypothetical protein|nr:hypothetical protein [Acidimicrobiales bacterium]